ncbi:alpha/beta fold hydrolase [Roseateles amylovorans]
MSRNHAPRSFWHSVRRMVSPDKAESVQTLVAHPPEGVIGPPILPSTDGFLRMDRDQFAAAFGADLPPARARFLADAQVPWGMAAFDGTIATASWRSKPSWYLVATDDRMIPPAAQRAMALRVGVSVSQCAGSHAIYESDPAAVAALIERAALGRR